MCSLSDRRDPIKTTITVSPRVGRGGVDGIETAKRLVALTNIMTKGANPDQDYFYLGGPMTGIPQFNFPEFQRAAGLLRERGYNIVSPAELDDPETEAAALASPDGAPGSGAANGESYEDFLGRDLIIVSVPTCAGMICLPGWEKSRGARGESWVVAYLKKPIYEYHDSGTALRSEPMLVEINRDERLRELGLDPAIYGSVPTDRPGLVTLGLTDEQRDIEDAQKRIEEHGRYGFGPITDPLIRTRN